MLILKFLLAVGAVLTSGLFALSAYLEPVATNAPIHVLVTPNTAALAAVAPPVKQVKLPATAAAPVAAPPKPLKAATRAGTNAKEQRPRRTQM